MNIFQTMGSRPEVNVFIRQMTLANEQKWNKRNEDKHILHEEFGPFAWCNRRQTDIEQQREAQLDAYAELIHYVAKVSSQVQGKTWGRILGTTLFVKKGTVLL